MKPARRCVKLYLSAAILALAGCVVPVQNYVPREVESTVPAIGTASTAHLGEEMLKHGRYLDRDAIQLSQEITIGLFGQYTLKPGIYVKNGEAEDKEFFVPGEGVGAGEIVTSKVGEGWKALQLGKDGRGLAIITDLNQLILADAKGITRTKSTSLAPGALQQTLIYNGRVGGKIRVAYREISSGQTGPTASNDVEYDLSESSTINYKGVRIEVLEATSQLIRYEVLQPFNQPAR